MNEKSCLDICLCSTCCSSCSHLITHFLCVFQTGEHGGPHQLPWESPLLHILCADKRSLSGGGYNPNGSGHSPQDALQKMMAHGTVHASSDAGE